jgi:hypothetical protein
MSPSLRGTNVSARETSSICPITLTSSVGGIEIFTPSSTASFFIESLPLTSGSP